MALAELSSPLVKLFWPTIMILILIMSDFEPKWIF